jgi:hypothetical protein
VIVPGSVGGPGTIIKNIWKSSRKGDPLVRELSAGEVFDKFSDILGWISGKK